MPTSRKPGSLADLLPVLEMSSAWMQFGLHCFVPGVRVSLVPSEAQLGMSVIV